MSGLGSQYEIIQKLGEGGMGTVYLAKDTIIHRLVAIKQLHRNSAAEEGLGERFQAEALALARLNHPNITHLYSFIPKEDTFWMIMEYVEGKTLEDWLAIHKKITHQLAASIAVQVLDGLQHAHRKGIIHRDIKPANVMINEEGEVKIMDFGIARMRSEQRMTSHGKSVGTLEYMAPEQIQGHEGDERTDLYAVGNILYEMLCGKTPFHSDTDYQLMKDKLEKDPESIQRENPTVPESFEKIIFKALHRQPNKRYKSASEMKNAIEKCVGGALLDQSTLNEVLRASQVFTEPQKDNEILSVNKILSQAKSISGKFKLPPVGKINRPFLILGASVFFCAILLIWGGSKTDDPPVEQAETNEQLWLEPLEESHQEVVEQSTGNFEETPSEMYQRISEPSKENVKSNAKRNKNSSTKKSVDDETNTKSSSTPETNKQNESTEEVIEDKIEESRTESRTPVEVPAGQSIKVTLMENLSSEEVERDGKTIRFTCNENIMAGGRTIIKKGATVKGKIVDCVPSTEKGEKALIGFVIQEVEAVDGSSVKLRSERFRLMANSPGKPVCFNTGQVFEAKLKRGIVE